MLVTLPSTRRTKCNNCHKNNLTFKKNILKLDKPTIKHSAKSMPIWRAVQSRIKKVRLHFLEKKRSNFYWTDRNLESNRKKAIKLNRKILKINPDSQNHIELAMELQTDHQFKDSVPIFFKAKELLLKETQAEEFHAAHPRFTEIVNENKVKLNYIKFGIRTFFLRTGQIDKAQAMDKLSMPEFAKSHELNDLFKKTSTDHKNPHFLKISPSRLN